VCENRLEKCPEKPLARKKPYLNAFNNYSLSPKSFFLLNLLFIKHLNEWFTSTYDL
jgi:hypothetical protein